ncbi:MAG: YkvA family protein [Thermomicrobiales bacterium]
MPIIVSLALDRPVRNWRGQIEAMDIAGWKKRASVLKREVQALSLAVRDPRTPWYARLLAILIVAYALSPLDLIPDPIPILGYLDDIILIPVGIALVLRLIPASVMAEARCRAADGELAGSRLATLGAVVVVLLWLATAVLLFCVALRIF